MTTLNSDLSELARYAAQAPSGHNTQPWKFSFSGEGVAIVPNLEKALPVVDADNRELFISLGCAAENLSVAARHLGYRAVITARNAEGITFEFSPGPKAVEEPLFPQIEKRQTNRSLYSGKQIPGDLLEELISIPTEEHIQLYFAEPGSSFAGTLTEFIGKGNTIQMNDAAFKNELLSWMRFNKKQEETTRDGLSYRVFGNPPLPSALAGPIVRFFLEPGRQNKGDLQKIHSSSHLVLFTTRHNTVEEWIDLGRTLQRFLLQATGNGISCAFLNQPCEINTLAASLQEILPVNGEYPTLILRIGYAQPLPYALRKKIEIV